jgi:murein DD-endopeptidase MepM/ murein hydrolase activator NlpD
MTIPLRAAVLLALIAGWAPALSAGGLALDGIWSTSVAGHTKLLALMERADGRLIGYRLEAPGSSITGGQRTGRSVTISTEVRDPLHPPLPGAFSGTLSGSHLTGTLTGPDGPIAVTLDRFHAPRTVVHWLLRPAAEAGDSLARAVRVEKGSGQFVTGGFAGTQDCDFLACGGRITAWTIAGTNHAMLTESDGSCPAASTLTGTWDAAARLLEGTFATTATCLPAPVSGGFLAGKEGLTRTGDVLDVLRLLRDFADRLEAESPAAADLFASTYLHDGKTKADWRAQLAAIYASYDSLRATIDAVTQVVTFADAEVNAMALPSPRLSWHLSVTGIPAGGGPVTPVLDLRSAFEASQELYWIGDEGGRVVFVGNGYPAPFSIAMPIRAGDAATATYGIWPLDVHGGGHPEGHPGWDVEFVDGAKVRAVADGAVDRIDSDGEFPGQVDVRVRHRPGITTQYGHVGTLEPGLAVGSPVVAGQALGEAGHAGGVVMTHFALRLGPAAVVCPLGYLDPSGLLLFTALWETAAYAEELVEPFPCNRRDVTFPRTRTWTRSSGALSPVIEFTRLDAATTDYRYALRDGPGGAVLEAGVVVALRPGATLDTGTLDLRPDGSPLPTRLARYRVVSGEMRIDWGATRPADLSAASVYGSAFAE